MHTAGRACGPHPRERHGRRFGVRSAATVVATAALVGLTLVAAGCSGSSGEGVAQVGTTNTTTSGADSQSGSSEPSPAAYAACMRENGVPSFPDPDSSGRFSGIDKRSPAVQAAQPGVPPPRPERRLAFPPAGRAAASAAARIRRVHAHARRRSIPRPDSCERPCPNPGHRRPDQSERADRDRSDCGMPNHART
jgi:hypothetical protein